MAKRRASKARRSVSRSTSSKNPLGIEFDSLTFLLFAVFVLLVSLMLVTRMVGMNIF